MKFLLEIIDRILQFLDRINLFNSEELNKLKKKLDETNIVLLRFVLTSVLLLSLKSLWIIILK